MNKSKKQHYVPRKYLQNFSSDGRLWVLDCASARVYPGSVRDVGHENYFYDFDESTKTTGGAPHPELQETERILSKIDDIQAARIRGILIAANRAQINGFSVALRWLCSPAFFQFFRTPSTRDALLNIQQLGLQSIVDKICEANFPDIAAERRPSASIPPENATVLHANFMFDNRRRLEWSRALLPQIWDLGYASEYLGFVCSDNPVVRSAAVCDVERRIELRGMGQFGASHFWPLDRKHLLVVRDRDFFEEERSLDGTVVQIPDDFINEINLLQVRNCKRFIYGNEVDFDPILRWLRSDEGVEERSKPTVEVQHTWIGERRSRIEVRSHR